MLSKAICKKCWGKEGERFANPSKGAGRTWLCRYALPYTFIDIEKQNREPPDVCPYYLEHQLETQNAE